MPRLTAPGEACAGREIEYRRRDFIGGPLGNLVSEESNFRMAESKIGMRAMHAHNKIALPLWPGDAIL